MDHLLSRTSDAGTTVPLEAFASALDGLPSAQTVADVATDLLAVGLEHAAVTRGLVALADDDRRVLDIVACVGYEDALVDGWRHVPVDAPTPVSDAYRSGDAVVVPSVEACRERYPDLDLADDAPHALVGLPLVTGARRVGAWGLRVEPPDPRELEDVVRVGRRLTRIAAGRIEAQRTIDALSQTVTQLEHALRSRIVVEQAKGILVERHGIELADAFEVLRRAARDARRRVHDVARDVVERRMDVDPRHR